MLQLSVVQKVLPTPLLQAVAGRNRRRRYCEPPCHACVRFDALGSRGLTRTLSARRAARRPTQCRREHAGGRGRVPAASLRRLRPGARTLGLANMLDRGRDWRQLKAGVSLDNAGCRHGSSSAFTQPPQGTRGWTRYAGFRTSTSVAELASPYGKAVGLALDAVHLALPAHCLVCDARRFCLPSRRRARAVRGG